MVANQEGKYPARLLALQVAELPLANLSVRPFPSDHHWASRLHAAFTRLAKIAFHVLGGDGPGRSARARQLIVMPQRYTSIGSQRCDDLQIGAVAKPSQRHVRDAVAMHTAVVACNAGRREPRSKLLEIRARDGDVVDEHAAIPLCRR